MQRLADVPLEEISVSNIGGSNLVTFPLEQADFEVQKLGRYFQSTCRLEEPQPHLKGVKDIVIIQHKLSSKDIRLILQPVTFI